MDAIETFNADYIDEQYRRWKAEPDSVSRDWQTFFKGFAIAYDRAPVVAAAEDRELVIKQSRVEALKYRYRDLGHLLACMDPLTACPTEHPLLSLEAFGLSSDDLNREFFTRRFARDETAPLKDIIKILRETYCRSIGVEYMHLQDPEERRWLQERMEPIRNRPQLEASEKLQILEKLIQSATLRTVSEQKIRGRHPLFAGRRRCRHPPAGYADRARGRRRMPGNHARHGPPGTAQRSGPHPAQTLR